MFKNAIIAILRGIFGKPVTLGIYVYDNWGEDKNPFSEKKIRLVEVVDVKDKWVQYRYLPFASENESMDMISFRISYKRQT